jgi:hypothetical protein
MAHPDMDALLDESLQVAIHFLEKNGEFFPFGVTMSRAGEIAHTQGWTGDECPPSQELIDLLLRGFVSGAARGDYKATALIYDVRISLDGDTKTDAIIVTIEHVDDEPVTCFLPYVKNRDAFEFGELVAERAERRVFKA